MGYWTDVGGIWGLQQAALSRLIKDKTVLVIAHRILIGELKKVDGVKAQKIRIVYDFVEEL